MYCQLGLAVDVGPAVLPGSAVAEAAQTGLFLFAEAEGAEAVVVKGVETMTAWGIGWGWEFGIVEG